MKLKLSLNQVINLIAEGGKTNTVLVEGPMGQGKSSMGKVLSDMFPAHTYCYFDCTIKQAGDVVIPKIKNVEETDSDYVRFATAEDLGAHLGGPVIINLDEIGKAPAGVRDSLMRLMLERKIGPYTLHPDSLVFATTNLAAEGLGDMIKPHHANRITVVTLRHMTNTEYIEWGVNNGVDVSVLSWAKDNPHAFASFEDYENPNDNEYIFHPRANRVAVCTPRSITRASGWVALRDKLDKQSLTAAICGTIGTRAGLDMMAHVDLIGQMPTIESIRRDPHNAVVPSSMPALSMVIYKALQNIDSSWADSWFAYLKRLTPVAQAVFVNGVRAQSYSPQRRSVVMNSAEFTAWVHQNNHLFSVDR